MSGVTRREFLNIMAVAGASVLASRLPLQTQPRPRRILLRSSWQTVNIGDIAHTPGVLHLLEQYLPDVAVTLWPNKVDNGVREMLAAAFPKVTIAEGTVGKDGEPSTVALRRAWADSDLLLHGSGPSVVAEKDVAAWRRATGKPYGIYGVTIGGLTNDLRDLLSAARFVFCRDTLSLKLIRDGGVTCPVMEFAPDGTFAMHLRDEPRAEAYLQRVGLEPGQFICAVPRLRYTPYYKIHPRTPTAEDLRRDEINEQYRTADHAKLREALSLVVRQIGLRVLACPEMTYEIEVARQELYDAMPEDVRAKVVHREEYWRPDEAASVYARALAVVSFECHSPIIAAAVGTPLIHLRQPTDTIKGQMYRDIGLGDWLFEADEMTGEQVGQTLLAITRDPHAAKAKLAKAMEFVQERQRESMAVVRETLS